MPLIIDLDDLSQGLVTAVSDAAWTASSGATTTITSATNLPPIDAGMFFEVRDHSQAENNGLYVETGGTPTTSSITADKVDGPNPTNQTAEAIRTFGSNATVPDELSVMIDLEQRRLYLIEQGNLSVDGVTGQALYSFLKVEWKADADLIPFTLPMGSITPEQFEFIEGWEPRTVVSPAIQSKKLIRTGGWSEIDNTSVLQDQYTGIITTINGLAEAVDQPYFQLGLDPTDTAAAIDFTFAGPVNEAIRTYNNVTPADPATGISFVDGGGGNDQITRTDAGNWITEGYVVGGRIEVSNATIGANNGTFVILSLVALTIDIATGSLTADTGDNTATFAVDNRNAVKVFSREPFTTSLDPDSGKTFSSTDIAGAGFVTVDNKAFRFTLATVPDVKVNTADATISSSGPWDQIVIKYFDGIYSRDVDSATNRFFGMVVDVGTHSGIDGATVATSVLTSADGGIPVSTYDGGVLTMHSGADEGTTFPIVSTTATTVTVTGTFGTDTGQSFSLQRATPVVATLEQIYEKVQFQLRQDADIDDQATIVTGSTADELLSFSGDTLVTQQASNPNTGTQDGVMVEGFDANDTNRLTVTDNGGVTRTFPFVAAGTINFNVNLVDDPVGEFWMFFQYTERFTNTGFGLSSASGDTATLDSSVTDLVAELADGDFINLAGFTDGTLDGVYVLTGAPAGAGPWTAAVRRVDGTVLTNEAAAATVSLDKNPIDSPDAIIVQDNSVADIVGATGAPSVGFDFDYDNNVQGGRTFATDAAIQIRAIGETLAQFAETTGTITRAVGITFSVVAALERNFDNP
jgi:hypothetical protein